jgi:hypothetical protein
MVPVCWHTSGGITSASDTTIPRWICPLPVMAAGLRCWSSMHCSEKSEASSISDMMMWQMNGSTCVALHSPPVELSANPEFSHALVNGQELQHATVPPLASSTPPTDTTQPPPPTTKERGNASCHGFWERGRTCIFDMHITDTDARSYQKKEFEKVLEQHEKEKKDKYLQTCLEMQKAFTPMEYLVDRIAGREARNAEKRLATQLAGKWKQGYSQMVYYVRVWMAIAVVWANSLLIRGSRDQQKPWCPLIPDGTALGDWQTWQDN